MIKVGDKVRFVSKDGPYKFGEMLVVSIADPNDSDDSSFFIRFKDQEEEGFWSYPDPEFFELVEKEVGVKYDSNKIRFDLVPPECEAMIAAVLTIGSLKYSAQNWQKIEDIQTRYFNAESRHMNAKRLGEVFDPETGLPHSAQAVASLIFILWEDIKDNIGADNVLSFINEKLKAFKESLDKK